MALFGVQYCIMTRHILFAVIGSLMFMSLSVSACGQQANHDDLQNRLPEFALNSDHLGLKDTVSIVPSTALDYYMALPSVFFNGLDQSADRRIWYIDLATLSDEYLEARYYFECDTGGFRLEIRLYQTHAEPVIAIHRDMYEKIYDDGKPNLGDPSITIETPEFYKFTDNEWIKLSSDLLPRIDIENVLGQYYEKYDAYKKYTGQDKYLWLEYELTDSQRILVTGRENFMDPESRNVWFEFTWNKIKERFE